MKKQEQNLEEDRSVFIEGQEEEETANGQKPEDDEEFDREMARLMEPDPEANHGKKKKKKEKKPWSRRRKIVTAAAAAAAFLVIRGMAGGGGETAPLVATQPLSRGSVQNRLAVTGPVSGTDSVDVVSNLHAEVTELLVKEGDKVEKDQLLAVIDSQDLEREVQVAQNAYDLAVAEKEQSEREAERGYAKALQDCQAAKDALDRTAALVQAESEAPVNLENAQNAYADALRQVDSYRVENGKAVADETYSLRIQSAAYELEKKQKDLENAQVKSPISGTVVRVNTKVGQFADKPENEEPMFIIENLDQLELEIRISEYSIGKVEVGQTASISADILDGNTVEGTVVSISPTGEEKGNGSSERVIPTRISIDDPESGLIAGITARAEIILEEAEDALIVPAAALLQKEDGSLYIQKAENGKVSLIPVDVGVEGDVNVEILPLEEGSLKEGDHILTAADPALSDGAAVTELPQV